MYGAREASVSANAAQDTETESRALQPAHQVLSVTIRRPFMLPHQNKDGS